MNLLCYCDYRMHDSTDNVPFKAYVQADEDLTRFWEAVDTALEAVARGGDRKSAWHQFAKEMIPMRRTMYQCPACGRIYLEDGKGDFHCFVPESGDVPKGLLRRDGGVEGVR